MGELEGRSEFINQKFGSITGKQETKDPATLYSWLLSAWNEHVPSWVSYNVLSDLICTLFCCLLWNIKISVNIEILIYFECLKVLLYLHFFFLFLHVLDSFLLCENLHLSLTIRKIRETLENREKHTQNYIANTTREIRKFRELKGRKVKFYP